MHGFDYVWPLQNACAKASARRLRGVGMMRLVATQVRCRAAARSMPSKTTWLVHMFFSLRMPLKSSLKCQLSFVSLRRFFVVCSSPSLAFVAIRCICAVIGRSKHMGMTSSIAGLFFRHLYLALQWAYTWC